MHGPLRFDQGSRSDVGCVRTVNEDACLARGDDGLWAVADGMGGHSNGRWASARIATMLELAPLPVDMPGAVAAVEEAVTLANRTIFDAGEAEDKVIGSTVAILLVRDRHFVAMWAGDSRVYRVREGVLSQLTTDHSQVEQMIASGLLTREEADGHPMAHMLVRAVGAREDVTLDRREGEILPGDAFLLCSDGLTRMVSDAEIADRIARDAPRRAATALVDLALERGAADNVTVVVVACDETTLVAVD